MAEAERPPRPRHIRIFLSSPGDVAEERKLARDLIEDVLRKDPTFRDHLLIEKAQAGGQAPFVRERPRASDDEAPFPK